MINVIIFSKDRPAQLELLLRSMKRFFIEWNMVSVSILYKYTTEGYRIGYEKTKLYHPEFDYVLELPSKFKEQTISLVRQDNQATMFFVDDMVFKNYLALRSFPIRKFLSDEKILCVAIRLCPRINYCYTERRGTPPPIFLDDLVWSWNDPELKGDYAYPMSLDGNIFRTDDILPLIKNLSYENPNTLEGTLARNPIAKPYMICYPDTLVFNLPVNKVQTANGNLCGNIPAEYLNAEFLNTKRISLSNLEFFKNTACHQEMPLLLEGAVKKSMPYIVSRIRDMSVNYRDIVKHGSFVSDVTSGATDINVYIPKKGRNEFLRPCLSYMNKAMSVCGRKIRVILLENDFLPTSRAMCKAAGVDYAFVHIDIVGTEGRIAKALMYNIGYLIAPKAKWNVFHDIDILVDEDYFTKLITYLDSGANWVQPYTKRRVIKLTKEITNRICCGETPTLHSLSEGSIIPAKPGSPGGSIVVSSDLFERVGGYDPELFSGYAPEDAFFWLKLECQYSRIEHTNKYVHGFATYADNPPIEVYHLDHESAANENIDRAHMQDIFESFMVFGYEDKKFIIDLQRDNLKKYLGGFK